MANRQQVIRQAERDYTEAHPNAFNMPLRAMVNFDLEAHKLGALTDAEASLLFEVDVKPGLHTRPDVRPPKSEATSAVMERRQIYFDKLEGTPRPTSALEDLAGFDTPAPDPVIRNLTLGETATLDAFMTAASDYLASPRRLVVRGGCSPAQRRQVIATCVRNEQRRRLSATRKG